MGSVPQEIYLGQALPAGAKLPASHVERSDSRESKIPAHGAGGALSGLLGLCLADGKRSTRPQALRVRCRSGCRVLLQPCTQVSTKSQAMLASFEAAPFDKFSNVHVLLTFAAYTAASAAPTAEPLLQHQVSRSGCQQFDDQSPSNLTIKQAEHCCKIANSIVQPEQSQPS